MAKRRTQKRTDQFQGESGATDYKTHPVDPQDVDIDGHEFSEVMESIFTRAQPIPPKVLEPETELAREQEMRRQDHIHEASKGKRRRRR